MTRILLALLIALCLLPLGGWADEKKYPLEYVGGIVSDASNDDTMACVLRNKKISCIKGQNQAKAEECPPIDCSLNSNRMCTTDENGCAVYVEDLTLTNVDVHATDKAVKEAKSQKNQEFTLSVCCDSEKCTDFPPCNKPMQSKSHEKIFTSICIGDAAVNCKYVVSQILEKRGKMWLIRREMFYDSERTIDVWINSEEVVWEPYEL